jgi:hypothetical protein
MLTNKEILAVADQYFGYSDFGNFYGKEDDVIEFAGEIMRLFNLALDKEIIDGATD